MKVALAPTPKKPTKVAFTVPPTLPAGQAGKPYSFALCVPVTAGQCGSPRTQPQRPSGGSPLYTFRLKPGAGVLPPGLVLSTRTGTITGTPRRAGMFRFTVCVFDRNTSFEGLCRGTTIVVRA